MLSEQQHMIETLKSQLHLALHRQFGPRNEYVDIDQLGLFCADTDASRIVEVLDSDSSDDLRSATATIDIKVPIERK